MSRYIYRPVQSVSELEKGKSIVTHGRTIFESDITVFCGVVGDTNQIHLNQVQASAEPIGRIVAPATLVSNMAIGLFGNSGWLDAILLPFIGMSEWRVERPVFPGDTIWSKITVQELRPTSDRQRYLLELLFEVFAHRGRLEESKTIGDETKKEAEAPRVMHFTAKFLVRDQEFTLM